MRTVAAAFAKLERSLGAAVRVRVRVVRKSDGWTVDLTDHCGIDWVRGLSYSENLDNSTVEFTVNLLRADGENTLIPIRASKANRPGPVLVSKRWVIVDVQPVPSDGEPDASSWIEVLRGQIERVSWNREELTVACRDESAIYVDRWQEYERNWPATVPTAMETVLQDLLDAGAYDPGPWVPSASYAVGGLVRPVRHNGYLYRVTAGGTAGSTEPSWPTTVNNTVVSGGVTFRCVSTLPGSAWSAAATYPLGAVVRPTTRNGYLYQCTAVTGSDPYTSAGSEPTWPTTYGGTVVDNEVTWTLVSDLPTLNVPTSPSWLVTRADANDYGSPPQAYFDLMRAFVDQIMWDLRWAWNDTAGQRQPRLRDVNTSWSDKPYNRLGDAGTFAADEYEITGDVEVDAADIRNTVDVVYFDGPESGPRTKTSLRRRSDESVTAYGALFCQLSMDSTGIINESAEAAALAANALAALSRPTVRLTARVAYNPWVEVGDGIKLEPPIEGALFDPTDAAGEAFVGVVQGLTHRIDVDGASTEIRVRGFYEANAEDIEEPPVRGGLVLAREVRARRWSPPTFQRPGDVVVHRFDGSGSSPTLGVKPGTTITFDSTFRDSGSNGSTGSNAFTAPVKGLYAVTAQVTLAAAPAAGTEMWLTLIGNGPVEKASTYLVVGTSQAGAALTMTVAASVYLDASEGIVVKLAATGSPTVTISSGIDKTFIDAKLIH